MLNKIYTTQLLCDLCTDLLTQRLPNGAEYLFVARDEADVTAWVQAINSVIQGRIAAPSSMSSALSSPPLSQIGSPTHSGNYY